MKRFTVLPLVVLLAAACSNSPTAPTADNQADTAAAGISANAITASLSTSTDAGAYGSDGDLEVISSRILPDFTDQDAATKLGGYIGQIQEQLAAGDKAEVARLVGLALAELAPGVSNGGDVGYVEIVLNNIARANAE